MSEQTIYDKSVIIRNETEDYANTRERVADILDEINSTKANKTDVDSAIQVLVDELGITETELYSYIDAHTQTPNLDQVLAKSNFAERPIVFHESEGRVGELNFNSNSYSYTFGDSTTSDEAYYTVAIGYNSLSSLTVGVSNIGLGSFTGHDLSGNSRFNVLIGDSAGLKLTRASANVIIGSSAAVNVLGEINVADLENISPILSTYGKSSNYSNVFNYDATAQTFDSFANTVVGSQALGAYNAASRMAGSTIIGQSDLSNIPFRCFNNIVLGAGNYSTAANSAFNNSVIIGNQINLNNLSSVLAIHNDKASRTNARDALIYGLFDLRTLKINGTFGVLASKLNPIDEADAALYTKNLVAKLDGTFGWEDKVSVPAPPTTGTFTLQSVDGVMAWVEMYDSLFDETFDETFN